LDKRVVLPRISSKYFAPVFDGGAEFFCPLVRNKAGGEYPEHSAQFAGSLTDW
jgi:hypothetical protein